MATGVVSWSQTAASNASADSTVNWAEGQAPSTVNDSARAVMASAAKWRDDMAGLLVTGGTSTAYTLSSNQGFASKSAMNGAEISFTVAATNGLNPTLNVDSLGGDPITLDGTNAVPTGTLIAGSVYTAVYYFSGTSWRLKDFYQLPYTVPIGGLVDFVGTSAPSSNFVFPYGQAISRSTYSSLFALTGTAFGSGDGSTTFNIPDLRGRVVAGKDDMGGSAASRLGSTYFGTSAAVLGATGGAESHTLTVGEMPSHSHTIADHSHGVSIQMYASTSGSTGPVQGSANGSTFNATTGTASLTPANTGGGSAHAIVQPTIILTKLLRII